MYRSPTSPSSSSFYTTSTFVDDEWRDRVLDSDTSMGSSHPMDTSVGSAFRYRQSTTNALNTTNSSAVISALKSLQSKIKVLEEERDIYKQKYDRFRDTNDKEKGELEQKLHRYKSQLSHERNSADRSKAELEILSSRQQEQIKTLRSDNEKILEKFVRQEQQIGQLQVRISELDAQNRSKDLHQQHLEKQLEDLRVGTEIVEKSRDELQRSLVKELHRREKLEDVNEQLDKTVKDMIAIQKELVQRSTPPGLSPQIVTRKQLPSQVKKKRPLRRPVEEAQWLPGTTQNSFHSSLKSRVNKCIFIDIVASNNSTTLDQLVQDMGIYVDRDMESIIESLQLEYDLLCKRYTKLLELPSSSDIDDVDSTDIGRYRLNAQEIRNVLTDMNKKGKELAILLQYTNLVHSTPYNKRPTIQRFINDVKKL
jgi:small-conductance mechanosensitive channel